MNDYNSKIALLLREETEDLKKAFVEKTRSYAENELRVAQEVFSRTKDDWCDYFGTERTFSNPDLIRLYEFQMRKFKDNPKYNNGKEPTLGKKFPQSFIDGGYYDKMLKIRSEYYSVYCAKDYVNKQIKKAEQHYENSLRKLLERLHNKGIRDNFEILEKRLGINFEMTLKSDLGKIVRCYTIVAHGEIQRPHYRFLVK